MSIRKKQIHPIKFIPLILMVAVLFITTVYSSLFDSLTIADDVAVVRVEKDIRITNFNANSTNNGAQASGDNFSYKNAFSSVILPNSTSTVTYNIEVTNIGNVEMGIREITGLQTNLEYTLTGYTLESTLCDSNNNLRCTSGSVTTFQITIGYAEDGYDGVNTEYNLNLEFDFYEIVYVARMDGSYYQTLQAAITAVPTNHTQKTIYLLKNTSEHVTINPGKDIILDFQGLVLSNANTNPIIVIRGNVAGNSNRGASLTISNGTIRTSATQGAINVEKEGTLVMTGGRIEATGNRQAIYIDDGGTVTISGNSFLTAQAQIESGKNRGTVQTVVGGTLNLLGGTIEATGTNGIAVSNAGTTTIGAKDGNVSTTNPVMIGKDYGVYISSGTLKYYDGIVKGISAAFNDENAISEIETDYGILRGIETINGSTYNTAFLSTGLIAEVTFDPDGGTVDEPTRQVLVGSAIGALPTPTKTDHAFLGWYDGNGRRIDATELINADITYTAHWQNVNEIVKIGTNYYPSLQDAVSAVPTDNTQTTIVVLTNITNENIVVASGKNIIFDLQNYTVSASSGIVLDNSGTVEIKNGTWIRIGTVEQIRTIVNRAAGTLNITGGTIQSDTFQAIQNYGTMNMSGGFVTIGTNIGQGVINNESGGIMNISGGRVIGTQRQAVYNDGGTLTISGDSYFESAVLATDKPRACIQNNKGTINILGGTIISTSTQYPAVLNNATMTIGTNDGVINSTSPVIQGKYYGLRVPSGKTVKYYDGVIKGNAAYGAIDGENRVVVDTQNNISIQHRSESIDDLTYDVAYLN